MNAESVTVGAVIQWLLNNAGSIVLLVGVVTGLVKILRKIDKLNYSVSKIDKVSGKVDNLVDEEFPALRRDVDSKFKGYEKRLESIETTIALSEDRREKGSQRSLLVFKGVIAALEGLQEIGANGPTKRSLSDMQDYLYDQAIPGAGSK